jgi:soluble lytic murein transglycosylase
MPMPERLSSTLRRLALTALGALAAWCPPAAAQPTALNAGDNLIVEAREAARKRDRQRLAGARAAAQAGQHPLGLWVEYWDLSARLGEVRSAEVEAFYARWPGSYVEDRLRNDWLQELGRRRDWEALARDYPRFRMNDDREVSCYWLLTEHLAGRDVRDAARSAWLAQRELDDGCNMLATAMVDARRFSADDVWLKARLAVEANRPAAARAAAGLLSPAIAREAGEALGNPAQFLRRPGSATRSHAELTLLALLRLAASDPDAAAALLDRRRDALSPTLEAWAWSGIARQSAQKLSPDAADHYRRAWSLLRGDAARTPAWSDDTLAWCVRSTLRTARPAERWPQVLRAIEAMSTAEQRDPSWVYWKARALAGSARPGPDGDARRGESRALLEAVAGPLGFYGQLAAEDLGRPMQLPAAPAAETPAERDAAAASPGLTRAMLLAGLGLRDESRREWNFTLRGMTDRELLAAARLACAAADWQLCINTADRTRGEVDVALRYPTPFAAEIRQAAAQAGLEPALVFGLIRQETRFMPQLRSSVGASGLMQVMPATGRWVAKKIGLDLGRPEMLADPATNLTLGTRYLKMVLDDLGGSQPLAAAAYNAGPGRPRRWRDGPVVETAVWAENIPFNETRDYVKKVMSNAAVYAVLLAAPPVAAVPSATASPATSGSAPAPAGPTPLLKPRLGPTVGPRDAGTGGDNLELP